MDRNRDEPRGRGFGPKRPAGGAPSRHRAAAKPPFRPKPAAARPPAPPPEGEAPAPAAPPTEERIAKVIARAGVASRRDAEAMIEEGRVTLNGSLVTSPALNVGMEDRITVDGEPLPLRERTRLWLFHKPRGLVTTFRDPQGRPTVFEALPEDMPRVVAVGRLDINTEGLLLLTNDGGLAKVVAHPETGWTRRYRVRVHGEVTQAMLDPLRRGITVEGMEYGPIEASLDREQGDNAWLTLSLREGKNREVKRVLEHLGLQVTRLLRVSFGPFQLGELEARLVEEVRTKVLREQLGERLAQEAGVDFDGPVRTAIAAFGSPKAKSGPREQVRAQSPRPGRTPTGRPRDDRSPGRGPVPKRQDDREQPRRAGTAGMGAGRAGTRSGSAGARDGAAGTRNGAPGLRNGAAGMRDGARRFVYRDAEVDEGRRPRRPGSSRGVAGAERAASAAAPRQRAASVESRDGRRVRVERVVRRPEPEEPRSPRRDPGAGPRIKRPFGRPSEDRGQPGAKPPRGNWSERVRAGPAKPREGRRDEQAPRRDDRALRREPGRAPRGPRPERDADPRSKRPFDRPKEDRGRPGSKRPGGSSSERDRNGPAKPRPSRPQARDGRQPRPGSAPKPRGPRDRPR